jgi:hypothetical protein
MTSIQHWGGTSSKERGSEKIKAVIGWLYEFDFSTRQILCELLGLDGHRGQGAFFKRLLDMGLIEPMRSPLIRHHVYQLSDAGRELALLNIQSDSIHTRRRQASPAVQIHDLTVQAAAMRRKDGLISALSERHISTGAQGKVPDALLIYENKKIALEVELTHKNSARIYYNFLCHLRNINNDEYSSVEYVFPTQVLADNYKAKFLTEIWPIYKPDQNRRLKLQPGEYRLPSEYHHLIQFMVEPTYEAY